MGGGLYLPSGFLDMGQAFDCACPFVLITGGRGTGKTYGALQEIIKRKITFLLMRRTQTQAELMGKPEFSPFKTLNADLGTMIEPRPVSKINSAFYNCTENEDGKAEPVGAPIGYTAALSTISNIRGFDASNVNLLLYDEFIPEPHEKKLKNEGSAFLNAYETINRNRELKGHKPLKCICLSNSNDIRNPIFEELKLVSKVEQMIKKGQEISVMKDRGIMLICLQKSPISRRKAETALYKLTQGSRFNKMAIENAFAYNDFSNIGSRPLREFVPIVSVKNITIYRHKQRNEYYVNQHFSGSPVKYEDTEKDLTAFRLKYKYLYPAYIDNRITFSDYESFLYFTKVWR